MSKKYTVWTVEFTDEGLRFYEPIEESEEKIPLKPKGKSSDREVITPETAGLIFAVSPDVEAKHSALLSGWSNEHRALVDKYIDALDNYCKNKVKAKEMKNNNLVEFSIELMNQGYEVKTRAGEVVPKENILISLTKTTLNQVYPVFYKSKEGNVTAVSIDGFCSTGEIYRNDLLINLNKKSPVKGDKVRVWDNGEEDKYDRVFFAMDGDKFVCYDQYDRFCDGEAIDKCYYYWSNCELYEQIVIEQIKEELKDRKSKGLPCRFLALNSLNIDTGVLSAIETEFEAEGLDIFYSNKIKTFEIC